MPPEEVDFWKYAFRRLNNELTDDMEQNVSWVAESSM